MFGLIVKVFKGTPLQILPAARHPPRKFLPSRYSISVHNPERDPCASFELQGLRQIPFQRQEFNKG